MQQAVFVGRTTLAASERDADLGTTTGTGRAAVSDAELWSSVRSGDAGALGLLFDRHQRAIYNYCFRQTSDWAAAEDLTSIVFLEAWRHRDVELNTGLVRAWLFGIPRNVVRNRRRSERRSGVVQRRPARDQHRLDG